MKIKLNRAARRHAVQRITSIRNKNLVSIHIRRKDLILEDLSKKYRLAKSEKERKAILETVSLKEKILENTLEKNQNDLNDNGLELLNKMDTFFEVYTVSEEDFKKFLKENDLLGWFESISEEELWYGFYPDDHTETQSGIELQVTEEKR